MRFGGLRTMSDVPHIAIVVDECAERKTVLECKGTAASPNCTVPSEGTLLKRDSVVAVHLRWVETVRNYPGGLEH
eukprot:5074025-Amphidinium_carterae.1